MGLTLLVASPARGQELQFQHYSTDEGFTGASFKRMTQDSLGFLWIMTSTGIYRFDGYNFDRLYDIQKSGVSAIDPQGNAWFGCTGKLLSFIHAREDFDSVKLPTTGMLPTALAFSSNTKVWIGSNGEGLLCFDRNTDSLTFKRNPEDSGANLINDITNDHETLLLGTSHGLWRYDPQQDRFLRPAMDENLLPQLYSGNVKKIFIHDTHYWVWVDDLFVKIRPNGAVVTSLDLKKIRHQFDPETKFSQAEITSIAEDQDEKFWITSTGLGLIYYDPVSGAYKNFRNDESKGNSLPSDVLYHVMIDRDQNVWCSTLTKGIVRLKKRGLTFYNYLQGLSSTGIEVLTTKKSSQIVVGTNGAGLWTSSLDAGRSIGELSFKPFKIESAPGFENILESNIGKSTLWLGSLNSGVIGLPISKDGFLEHVPSFQFKHRKDDPTSLSQNFITSIWESPDGYLWIGTFAEGLNIGAPFSTTSAGSFNVYKPILDNGNSMVLDIRMVDRQNDGSIFLMTLQGAYQVVNSVAPYEQVRFKRLIKTPYCSDAITTANRSVMISSTEGLFEGFRLGDAYRFENIQLPEVVDITCMQEDLLGRIWFMSFEGLFVYDPKAKFLLQFKKEDGLPSSRTVSAGSSAQTEDGIMIFSNAEGITVFDPLTMKINSAKPKPVLTNLRINNKRVSPLKEKGSSVEIDESIVTLKNLVLDHTHYIVELEFSAMDMTAPEKNRYKYRLEGFSDTWVETDWRNRRATYTNLRPGNYTFKVMTTNRDGVWSNHVATLEIVVLPPPWNTWWAYSLYTLVGIGILYVARRSILKEERLKASLRIEQVELEKKQIELLKAQEVDKLKSSFFTNISHEFRTPLTLIQGPVQLLLEKFSGDNKIKHQLDLVQSNVQLLLKLINQLLELSRLESGNLAVEKSPTDLNPFINSVLDYFESQVKQKNLSIHLDLPTVAHRIMVDKGKVETILINLIGNAMKFTHDHGRIFIKGWVEDLRPSNNEGNTNLCVVVGDNGIGIPEDKHAFVFDRFYQVSETHNRIGTGIGLALVKELTQLIGGTIEVKSKPRVGSEFAIKIPVQILTSTVQDHLDWVEHNKRDVHAIESNGFHEDQHNVAKILVVEDNHDLRQFIIDSFDGSYNFLEAATGIEGLEKAVHEIPELIISDIMMPEMDGITMSAKIKKDIRTCHIPILFLTAKATEKGKLTGLETGAEDYLTKPFNKDELILKVRNIISARDKIRTKLRLELLNEAPSVVAQSADEQFLVKVKEAIHQRLNDPKLGVDTISSDIGLSRTQLYRKVNALTGFTVNELIRTFRLKKAAQLIEQNWGGVSEVAYEVGFSNLSYFSKCFKEQFGVLPSAYNHSKHRS